jgi:hypothetical protein
MSSSQSAQTALPMAIDLQGTDDRQVCERKLAEAQREMGAFFTAVRRLYGKREAVRAAEYWIDFAESPNTPLIDGNPNWRHITIEAAGQLAKRRPFDHLSERAQDGALRPS